MKIDLHIHSKKSRYKESDGIVDKSTIENVEVLLNKLDKYDVGLFSITDHNRFDVELYKRLDQEIQSKKYGNVKGLLAGVEFDVQIDNDMKKCHIITIFDTQNEEKNYRRIESAIMKDLLQDKEDYYSKERFEKILKDINLDVILIACQRNDLCKSNGKHNSLSESTKEPIELIKAGYINALEFQKPNVEGILKNNLKEIPENVSLVMGSDCHEWSEYHNHDKKHGNPNFSHSRANILPTFKGLLMAVTSPETRINQQKSKNIDFINKFKLGNKEVKLVNGINVIIGENGSGKSTLLNLINNANSLPQYAKNLIKINELSCEKKYESKKLYIGQGDIVSKFSENNLFDKGNYIDIDNEEFIKTYENYAKNLFLYIKKNIEKKDYRNTLSKTSLEYSEQHNLSTYFIQISSNPDFTEIINIHEENRKKLYNIINDLKKLLEIDYFNDDNDKAERISRAIDILNPMLAEIEDNSNKIETERKIKNIIYSELSEYNKKIKNAATSQENDQRDYIQKRIDFISTIVSSINKDIEELNWPNVPEPIIGHSRNPKSGFSFNSEARYDNKDVHEEFLKKMFTQEFATLEKLKLIDNEVDLIKAIRGCTEYDQIDNLYKENLDKFIKEMCICKNYIVDISNNGKSLGSTLGEQSLAYYRYITEFEKDKCIFLIDQPEDHISNNNISQKLINYFNSIRNKKQIVLVTHNPLLVVNLDVDQVIFVNKNNNKMNIISGCLEYEDKETNILELIAENMDGGKASIEKRLRVYG